jgi:predicted nucleic acid-binding protein
MHDIAVERSSTRLGTLEETTMSDLIIDANVIRNIGQGNRAAAEALTRLLKSGRKIYIAHAAYDEIVVIFAEYRQLLKDLGLGVSPRSSVPAVKGKPGVITARGNVYADNMQQVPNPKTATPGPMKEYGGKKDPVSGAKTRPGDAFVAAEAKSLEAELWTLDQQFARQAHQQGVKIAAESNIASVATAENPATARELLKDALHKPATTPVPKPAPTRAAKMAPKPEPKPAPKPTPKPVETAAPPVPTPTTGPVRPRLEALKAGLKGAVSPESIASLIPDAILAIADKFAVRDALRNIQTKFIKEGFAKGVAAGVAGWSQDDVGMELKNRVNHGRVRGLGDAAGTLKMGDILRVAESYENYAVDVGFQYTFTQSQKWIDDMKLHGWFTLRQRGYPYGEDDFVDYTAIDRLAWAIGPKTNAIVGPAIRFN